MRSLMLMLALCAGCGARSGLEPLDLPAPVTDAGVLPDVIVVPDAGTDAGSDAGSDAGPPGAGVCDAPLVVIEQVDICGPDLLMGEDRRDILYLQVTNRSGRTLRGTMIRPSIGPILTDGCIASTLHRFRLVDSLTGITLGSADTTMVAPGFGEAEIRPDAWMISPGVSQVGLQVDTTAFVDGGCRLSVEIGVFSDDIVVEEVGGGALPESCVCACLGGFPFYVQTGFLDVYRARISVTHPDVFSWIVRASGEQEVGGLVISNEPNAGNYMATVDLFNVGFHGVFGGDIRPRTLRVYRDTVAPENLLASTTFADGQPVETTWRRDDFVDTDIAAGTRREFRVTLDSDGMALSSSMDIEMTGMTWTDGIAPSGSLACGFPIGVSVVTFVPAP